MRTVGKLPISVNIIIRYFLHKLQYPVLISFRVIYPYCRKNWRPCPTSTLSASASSTSLANSKPSARALTTSQGSLTTSTSFPVSSRDGPSVRYLFSVFPYLLLSTYIGDLWCPGEKYYYFSYPGNSSSAVYYIFLMVWINHVIVSFYRCRLLQNNFIKAISAAHFFNYRARSNISICSVIAACHNNACNFRSNECKIIFLPRS